MKSLFTTEWRKWVCHPTMEGSVFSLEENVLIVAKSEGRRDPDLSSTSFRLCSEKV